MTKQAARDEFADIAASIAPGGRLVRAWPLAGGVSAEVTGLEVQHADGSTQRVVVRRHGPNDLARNPSIAVDEFRLLAIVQAYGIAAPRPLLVYQTSHDSPAPYLAMEYMPGRTIEGDEILGYVDQLATELSHIHTIADEHTIGFLPRRGATAGLPPSALDVSLSEDRIRRALLAAGPPTRQNPPVLLHGDYWPGNVLFKAGRLAAVIDWEDAAVGDPLADVANGRFELFIAAGEQAVRAFTEAYRVPTSIDLTALPYWELMAALRPCRKLASWGLASAAEARFRARHRAFVERAIADLGVQA